MKSLYLISDTSKWVPGFGYPVQSTHIDISPILIIGVILIGYLLYTKFINQKTQTI